MKKVVFHDYEVSTLDELAGMLKREKGWESYEIVDGAIEFVSGEGRRYSLDQSGKAYEIVDGDLEIDEDEEESVDFAEDLLFGDMIWGKDEDGNDVLVHARA